MQLSFPYEISYLDCVFMAWKNKIFGGGCIIVFEAPKFLYSLSKKKSFYQLDSQTILKLFNDDKTLQTKETKIFIDEN